MLKGYFYSRKGRNMNTDQPSFISRRSFIKAGVVSGPVLASSLVLPSLALAEELPVGISNSQNALIVLADPGMTAKEISDLHDLRLEEEVSQIIADAMANDERLGLAASSRPTYTTKYGSKVEKWTPWKTVPGQPDKGTQIQGSGSIFVAPSGGGTVSCSWSFGTPYGTLGISYTLGKRIEAGGYCINVSGTGFYLAQHRKQYLCQPYVVYVTQNGKKSVYRRALASTFQRQSFRARKC